MTDIRIKATVPASGELRPLVRRDVKAAVSAWTGGDSSRVQTVSGRVPATGVTLDLLTYNCWGLPGLIGKRQGERMPQIGNAVRGHGIVTLQETFTRKAAVIGKLGGYAQETKGGDGGPFRLSSGLRTLTNYQVLETDFAPFKKATDADRFAGKGVLFTRLQVPGVGPVDVYNTHYQAQDGNEAYRQHDNEVMASLIMRHEQGNPTFVMGDFNFTSSTKEYERLMLGLGLRDAHAEKHPGHPGYTSTGENTNNKPTKTPARIDYIFVKGGNRYDIAIESVDRAMTQKYDGKHASDHFGVHGRFVLRPRPAATAVHPN
jgi:endonuclease/exonuclease/phosphatase family metal-dependent hydrolase